jgi:hypothetical protein
MNTSPRAATETVGIGRRRFLQLGVLGGGASLLGLPAVGQAKSHVPVLLLSCMDYRLVQATERYMSRRGLKGKYDHVILAGASLGATSTKVPAWNTTFWEHVPIAIRLHGVSRVMVLDHRECGAYDELLPGCCTNPDDETKVHTETLRELRKQINERHSQLRVELLIMDLKGKVETIK